MGCIGTISLSFKGTLKRFFSKAMPSQAPSVYQSLCQVWGDGHLSHYSGSMWDLLGLTTHASLIEGGAEHRMICSHK